VRTIDVDGFGKEIKAVQLTDLHIGSINNRKFLDKVVKMTNELNPDVVFITGDLVDGSGIFTESYYDPLDDIEAPVYFIHGNHETYEGLEPIEKMLKKKNITLLKDDVRTFRGIQIAGLMYTEDKEKIRNTIESLDIDRSKPAILLNHAPSGTDIASKKSFDLQLSGHTHGGQIFPFNFLVKLAFPYVKGRYQVGDMVLYINQGTGTWGPPMRLGTRSEITQINLKK